MNDAGKTIVIVEDEPQIAGLLQDYLRGSGFSTRIVGNGLHAVATIRAIRPALVLLDLMLPGKDGLAICREVRDFSAVPIIMVTARIEEIDRLLGLEIGADDYVCKPFSPREVVARVKAVLRRAAATPVDDGLVSLDEGRHEVRIGNQTVALTAVEFQLLKLLVSEPGRIFSRGRLMAGIYPDHRVVSDRTIDSHIKKLRRKLEGAAPELDLIRSVYGVGYRFEFPAPA
ncbi:MAG: response regulator [Gammaproteobacteria bacterium]|nr:response regulator [Gammaproteobacteria bacterium]